jgi:hypothetical protein
LPQLRLRGQGKHAAHDSQADQGKTVVGDFKETVGDVGCECSQASGEWV